MVFEEGGPPNGLHQIDHEPPAKAAHDHMAKSQQLMDMPTEDKKGATEQQTKEAEHALPILEKASIMPTQPSPVRDESPEAKRCVFVKYLQAEACTERNAFLFWQCYLQHKQHIIHAFPCVSQTRVYFLSVQHLSVRACFIPGLVQPNLNHMLTKVQFTCLPFDLYSRNIPNHAEKQERKLRKQGPQGGDLWKMWASEPAEGIQSYAPRKLLEVQSGLSLQSTHGRALLCPTKASHLHFTLPHLNTESQRSLSSSWE